MGALHLLAKPDQYLKVVQVVGDHKEEVPGHHQLGGDWMHQGTHLVSRMSHSSEIRI